MTGELEPILHTESVISEYFVIESSLLSTRTADMFRALDKSRGTHVSLWVMRRPFALNSPAVKKFISRLSALQKIEPPVTNLHSFGVDADGVAFCVFPNLNGFSIDSGNIEPAEAERRLIAASRVVERIHNADVVCGDICSSSFWIERTGDLKLVGVMGGSETDFVGDPGLPPTDALPFMAPEQVSGQADTRACDVYAMGVLGHYLICKKYPFPPRSKGGSLTSGTGTEPYQSITRYQPNPPAWADQVFSKALHLMPQERYDSAGEFVQAIGLIRESVYAADRTPARLHREGRLVKKDKDQLPRVNQPQQTKSVVKQAPGKKIFLKVAVVISAVFLLSFLIFREILGRRGSDPLQELPDAVKNDPNLGPIVQEIGRDGDTQQKEKYLRDLVASDDPLSHDILIKAARASKDEKERAKAETALLDRARRLGLRRSVEVVRPWLRSVRGDQLPESYESILRSLDVTLPLEARNASLRQAYASNPRIVLRLTSALALDSGKFKEYQPVLSQLVGDSTGEDLAARSLPAIILYSTELVASFGDDIVQKKEEIPDGDIPWLLNILSLRNDIYVRPVASLAVDRGLLPEVKKRYLSLVRDREDLPPDILNTLVKAAAGNLKPEEVRSLGAWWDRGAEDILIYILGDKYPEAVKIEAFDILASKSFSREPAATLVKWVRANAWEQRKNYLDPIGVLSNLDSATEEKIITAISAFEKNLKDPAVLGSLIDSNQPAVVKAVIEKYPNKVGLGKRILLLDHPDKQIRILAIKSLAGLNDVAGLKIILDHFETEKDQDVKKAYRDNFWVVGERENKTGNSMLVQ